VKKSAFTFRFRPAISSIRDRHARVHGRLWASNPLRDSSEQIGRGAVAFARCGFEPVAVHNRDVASAYELGRQNVRSQSSRTVLH